MHLRALMLETTKHRRRHSRSGYGMGVNVVHTDNRTVSQPWMRDAGFGSARSA
jgi:hypothetical protein